MILFIINIIMNDDNQTTPNCTDIEPYKMYCEPKDPNTKCTLFELVEAECHVPPIINCSGSKTFTKNVNCSHCYQLDESSIFCEKTRNCKVGIKNVPQYCYANATCIGKTKFKKLLQCEKSSLSQKTAIFLSLFLGCLGADRFYLGYFLVGIGKLFTFGGIGILYMIDFLLILVGYLGPADGSLYEDKSW